MKRALLTVATVALLALTGCGSEKVELQKSPCVGADDSPCGPKRSPEYNV